MKTFRLSPEAARDIEEIWWFIARDDIEAAQRVRSALLGACRNLARNPGLGHQRSDLTQRPVRFWPVYSYVIIYKTGTKPLEIARVVHGARRISDLI